MSLYAEYMKETRDFESIEDERGFITYLINGEECYIETIYVSPAFRKSKVGWRLADEVKAIAKDRGCRFLTGTINIRTKNPEASMLAQLTYGFKIALADKNSILLKMEI